MSDWIKRAKEKFVGCLQLENKNYILLENGYRIIIGKTDWGLRDKISTSWTKRTKPN
jgi:hypothetical protein